MLKCVLEFTLLRDVFEKHVSWITHKKYRLKLKVFYKIPLVKTNNKSKKKIPNRCMQFAYLWGCLRFLTVWIVHFVHLAEHLNC